MKPPRTPLATVAETAKALGIGRSLFYEEVAAGRWDFAKVKVGTEIRLSWPAIESFLANPRARTR